MTYYLRLFYFHIYDSVYSSDLPHLTAYGFVVTSLGCSISVFFSIVGQMINGTKPNDAVVWAGMGIAFVLGCFLFLYKGNYNKIYNEFHGSEMDSKSVKIISWLVFLAQFSALILCSFILDKQ